MISQRSGTLSGWGQDHLLLTFCGPLSETVKAKRGVKYCLLCYKLISLHFNSRDQTHWLSFFLLVVLGVATIIILITMLPWCVICVYIWLLDDPHLWNEKVDMESLINDLPAHAVHTKARHTLTSLHMYALMWRNTGCSACLNQHASHFHWHTRPQPQFCCVYRHYDRLEPST